MPLVAGLSPRVCAPRSLRKELLSHPQRALQPVPQRETRQHAVLTCLLALMNRLPRGGLLALADAAPPAPRPPDEACSAVMEREAPMRTRGAFLCIDFSGDADDNDVPWPPTPRRRAASSSAMASALIPGRHTRARATELLVEGVQS